MLYFSIRIIHLHFFFTIKDEEEPVKPKDELHSFEVTPLRTPITVIESPVSKVQSPPSPWNHMKSPKQTNHQNFNSMSFALSLLQHSPMKQHSASDGEFDLHDDELDFLESRMLHFVNHSIGSSPNAVICCDAFGKISVFNKAAEEILGFSYGEIVGRRINELMPPHFAIGTLWITCCYCRVKEDI